MHVMKFRDETGWYSSCSGSLIDIGEPLMTDWRKRNKTLQKV